jgi:16S rRNA (guanine527-N7)-methyltransferase
MIPDDSRMRELLAPYVASFAVPPELYARLNVYLDLLLRWNSRTNLTAVRDAEEIVTRHFGESLFAGVELSGRLAEGATVLDIGSGAGFPGLPIQLLLPRLRMTLAESQGKKAAFLREAVRVLGVAVEVWPLRVEEMAADRRFGAVTLRAVDRMDRALVEAERRLMPGGWLAVLAGAGEIEGCERLLVPGSRDRWLGLRRVE